MENISALFDRLGFTLHNKRWSWGARSDLGVLLRTWVDDLDESRRYVRVLGRLAQDPLSAGLNERIDHLRTLWSGGLAGYVVLATAKDSTAVTREIASYDSGSVRAIVSLLAQSDGSVWAELGEDVPVERIKKHAAKHRLIPADGLFPELRHTKVFKDSGAAYIAKLPDFRKLLIDVARRGETITYKNVRTPFGLRTLELRHVMDRIGHACVDAGEPILTALIVDPKTMHCSPGFYKEFRRDEFSERKDCYAFWSPLGAQSVLGTEVAESAASGDEEAADEALRKQAARFAKVAVRPEQAAFRRRVFLAHKGACAVTGCTIQAALDAAHRKGRYWRCGHNSGADGLLLRKDIHALYDAGLVTIDDGGVVIFAQDVAVHYGQYVRTP